MQKGKVLIACKAHPLLAERLLEQGYQVVYLPNTQYHQGIAMIRDCVGLITANNMKVDQQMIDAAPNLKFVGRMGSGMEIIDVDYAFSKSVRCFSSPDGNCNAVAEHALGMLLALNKNIVRSNAEILEGKWLREENRGTELEGKTIGIIGYGHTGTAFAKLLSAFGMKILVYDKYKEIGESPHINICNSMEPIFAQAEIISLHVPLRPDTEHLVDESFIQKMERPFVLLNTSRGNVVQSSQLAKYLDNQKILALGLDVWEEEPLDKMSVALRHEFDAVLARKNVIITPHIAGYSQEALYKMSLSLLKQIIE